MYVVKDYDERKNEFLDTAMRLFMERGYEDTSVNAIIDSIGVSKGAFYHYFKTKEELLDELAARASVQAMAVIQPIVDDPSLSAVEKFNAVFAATNAFKAQNRDLILTIAHAFYSDRNVLLRARMNRRSIEMIGPVLAQIIGQGNEEGTMSVAHPEITARFVLETGASMVSEFAQRLPEIPHDPRATDDILLQLHVYTEGVERILGVEPGELTLVDDSMITIIKGDRND